MLKRDGGGWQSLLPLADLSRKIKETLLEGTASYTVLLKIELCSVELCGSYPRIRKVDFHFHF